MDLGKLFKKNKGYTLIELLVSMAIFAMMLIMLNQLLFSALRISQENYLRSVYREAQNELFDFIKRDIRNADKIVDCPTSNSDATCTMIHSETIRWKICENNPNALCRYRVERDQNNQETEVLVKQSASTIFIRDVDFEMISDISNETEIGFSNNTIIVTIESGPVVSDEKFEEIQNGNNDEPLQLDVQQIVVSTRNANQ